MAVSQRTLICAVALILSAVPRVRAQHVKVPTWLPRYDLAIRLDTATRQMHVKQRTTWVNRHARPTNELVFNTHAHYEIPDGDVGLLAKMVEILRVAPKEALPFEGPALRVQAVELVG